MRIAICYFGMTGFTDGKENDGEKLLTPMIFQNNIERLIKPNNADVYVHSWSTEAKELVLNSYNPKNSIFEKTKLKSELIETKKIRIPRRERIKKVLKLKNNKEDEYIDEFYRASSRWLSTKKSIELAISSCIEYDVILSIRLDIMFNRTFKLPENISEKELLVSHWNDAYFNGTRAESNFINHTYVKRGFLDLWFAGKVSTMEQFCEIFDKRYLYSASPHLSSFQHCKEIGRHPRFELYRGFDYELHRRQNLKSTR